ncbi:MAG: hypothetical protein JWN46_808 [Acidimicrobiales bacterium]|nr:hypothetical protein [Acidimicrobiales bacterium]
MKRRTLDLTFAVAGLVLAVLVVSLGLVLRHEAVFTKHYVQDQLAQQRITFTPVAQLAPDERRAACLITNAGRPLVTGKQAECYANRYIGHHVGQINAGQTYAQTQVAALALGARADGARAAGDPAAPQLAGQAAALRRKGTLLFEGETTRGLLLTSYGFSILGERAALAARVCFVLGAVVLAASLSLLVHALGSRPLASAGAPPPA